MGKSFGPYPVAGVLFDEEASGTHVACKVVIDLGFGIYTRRVVRINAEIPMENEVLIKLFVEEWCKAGGEDLRLESPEQAMPAEVTWGKITRKETTGTGIVTRPSLTAALRAQGICD